MRKVIEYYCDVPEMLKLRDSQNELVRRLAIYIEGDLLQTRGYFKTYFPKAESGQVIHSRMEGEKLLKKITQSAQEFAELEIPDEKHPGRFKKRKYSLIPIEEN